MSSFRWFRATARGVLGLIELVPAVALVLAVFFDRGPTGEARVSPHLFPVVLWIVDDFAWTCARNSVVFALVVSLTSLVVGVGLSWVVARRRFWGRSILRSAVAALMAAPPAFVALGILGLLGPTHPWPWPFVRQDLNGPGATLESWPGLPLWIVWVWSTLPGAAALVAFAVTAPVERLERSWEDAARLAGATRFRIWFGLSWPIVRPGALRAAALVFLFSLVEPGAPLILGLRRTLAFQIVEAAGRSDPFPRIAVWAVMAGLYGLAGWALFRWWAGRPILDSQRSNAAVSRNGLYARRALPFRAFASTLVLAAWALGGWLPLVGLVQLAAGPDGSAGASTERGFRALFALASRNALPPVPQLVVNSLVLGLEVACGIMIIAWFVQPDDGIGSARTSWLRFIRPIAKLPPLVMGAGVLAVPWLAGLASRSLLDSGRPAPARALENLAEALDPYRNSGILMACCVVLALAPRLLSSWRGGSALSPSRAGPAFEAALLAGASRARARWLSAPWRHARWLGRFVLVWALAATNLTPSLLFAPWADGRTVAPGVVVLAGGAGAARSQAAALALGAVAVNIGALAFARLTSALPRSEDFE